MLLYNIESISRKLKDEYENVTSHLTHMGVMGGSRESILRKYLGQLLPQKYSVGTGIITDFEGNQSRQQDFFIYDAFNSPVFYNTEESCVIPTECVYATIEVKSTLTKSTLTESLKNIQSVKQLKKKPFINSPLVPDKHNLIFGAIFAYSSDASIITITKNLHTLCLDIPKEQQPSVVCILDKGLLVNVSNTNPNEICLMPTENTTWALIENTSEKNLYLFYLLLLQHLNTTTNFPPDLIQYAQKQHVLDNLTTSIPIEMLSEKIFIPLGKIDITGEEIQRINKMHPYILKAAKKELIPQDIEDSGMSEQQFFEEFNYVMNIFKRFINQKTD